MNEDLPTRLTVEERAAVERAIETLHNFQKTLGPHSAIDEDAATLRGLLKRNEIALLRLTNAEREAIDFFAAMQWPPQSRQIKARAATLRILLSRTGQNSRQTGDNQSKCTDREGKTPERDQDNSAKADNVGSKLAHIEANTLTDEKREAVEWAVAAASDCEHPAEDTLRSLLTRLRLTDAEREAIEVAAEAYAGDHGERFAATLRSLLERMK